MRNVGLKVAGGESQVARRMRRSLPRRVTSPVRCFPDGLRTSNVSLFQTTLSVHEPYCIQILSLPDKSTLTEV